MRKPLALAILAIWMLFLASSVVVSAAAPQVNVVTVKGVISPILSGFIAKSIRAAEADGAVALVMEIDTPGGLDSSMREIIQSILNSKVPVVAYVWPPGSRDASAGVYITMASHVAAMAPNTNIGAAHPVALGGSPAGDTQTQPADTEMTKITNDAVAYIKGLAEQRGRNAEWAEQAVRLSVSITAAEARNLRVIDFVAADLPDLLRQMDGLAVNVQGGPVTLHTSGASIHRMDMGAIEQFLLNISDPNIAFLLLSLAVTALFIEFANPGLILPGVIGGISLLLALFSLGQLPVNYAGMGLILLAFVLFILEIKIISYGMLTIGGLTSMVLGGLLLVNSASVDLQVSRTLIAFVALATAAAFFLVVRAVRRAQRRKPTTGSEGLIGATAVTRSALAPDGFVFLEGERWAAVSESGLIPEGESVEVVAKDGFRLRVRKKGA